MHIYLYYDFPLIYRLRFQFLSMMSLVLHYQALHVFSSIACLKFILHNSNSGNADQVFCKYYALLKLSVLCQVVFLWNTFLIFFTLTKSIHSLVLSLGVTSAGCSLTCPPTTHFPNWIKSFPVLPLHSVETAIRIICCLLISHKDLENENIILFCVYSHWLVPI